VSEKKVAFGKRLDSLLRVGSYNVHRCIGLDGLCRPQRIASVITELGVDILGLQEVDSSLLSLEGVDQGEYLAEASGLNMLAAPTMFRNNGHFGNTLLTRFEVLSWRQIDLSVPGREPRGALDVRLDCYGRIVRVIVTHLGLGIAERKAQVARLLDAVALADKVPTILVGDMNEWIPRAWSLRSLRAAFNRSPSLRTFPSRLPVLPLDRIFVWPHDAFIKAKVHMSKLARIASDHLPVKGFIVLKH
jgi:endonuclease/exonuclease/phosphatase family metal-dependent hydrolase